MQLEALFKKAFGARSVLGSLEENDEEGDPGDDDVLEDALAGVEGLELAVDLGKMSI
jgi:hypothetical protein